MKLSTILNEVETKELLKGYHSNKEYLVFDTAIFNIGVCIAIRCTNDFNKYQNISEDGYSCILSNDYELNELIKEELVKRFNNMNNTRTKFCYNETFESHLKRYNLSEYNYRRLIKIAND